MRVLDTQWITYFEQVAKASTRANKPLRLIAKSFHYRDKKIYVRPHLEYAIQSFCPYSAGASEKVHNRAIIKCLKGSTYAEKLSEVGLSTLQDRRQDLQSLMKKTMSENLLGLDEFVIIQRVELVPVTVL